MASYLFNWISVSCCGILAIIAVCWVSNVSCGGNLIKDIVLRVKLPFSSQLRELISANWKHWSFVASAIIMGLGTGIVLMKYAKHVQVQMACIILTYIHDMVQVSRSCSRLEYGNYYGNYYVCYSMILRNVCVLGIGSLLIFSLARKQKMSRRMKMMVIIVGGAAATNGGIADSWDQCHEDDQFIGGFFCYCSAWGFICPVIFAWILWSCLVKREESLEGEKTKESKSAVESTC